jgi:hypothetical protein
VNHSVKSEARRYMILQRESAMKNKEYNNNMSNHNKNAKSGHFGIRPDEGDLKQDAERYI